MTLIIRDGKIWKPDPSDESCLLSASYADIIPEIERLRALSPLEPTGFPEIRMDEVRLCAGEGKLTAREMLAACNAVIRMRNSGSLRAMPMQEQKDICIDCEGPGVYPNGSPCKSCGGLGLVSKGEHPLETSTEKSDLLKNAYAQINRRDTDIANLLEALGEVVWIVENKADADDGQPNDAMRLLTVARGAIMGTSAMHGSKPCYQP